MEPPNFFGRDVAATYDRDHGGTDPALVRQTVETLSELAEGGDILECAIGTGRIALPLLQRGHRVAGIELSPDMVAQMRAKPAADQIEVTIGDMTTAEVEGAFALVCLVFNTIDNLTTQDAQVACFRNAARHLAPGGRFVVETLVPPVQRLPFGETLLAFDRSPAHWGIDEFDIASQSYSSHHIWRENGTERQVSIPFRYAWPAEMDLMAQIAGLAPEHRWSDWARAQFTLHSRSHISVWRKPG